MEKISIDDFGRNVYWDRWSCLPKGVNRMGYVQGTFTKDHGRMFDHFWAIIESLVSGSVSPLVKSLPPMHL